jgi:oxygen-independent coproporphyrinogen-3 oxidase
LLPLRDAGPPSPLGSLYVHVPFCRDRCSYCAFPTVHDEPALHAPLVEALLARAASAAFPAPLRTLYLGGGTPGLLPVDELRRLLDGFRASAAFDNQIEITLEANPRNITQEALVAWRAAGVTRLSLGVQSFDDAALARHARLHDGAEARRALATIAEHWLGTWSADLLVGWAGQSPAGLLADLETLLEHAPPHVSVYGLTLEPRTPLARRARAGHAVLAPAPLQATLDGAWSARLRAAGLERYEVSNFARPGHRSRHNQAYWINEAWLGFGPGAASSLGTWRWIEREEPRAWIAAARTGRGVRRTVERLAPAQRLLECVSVGLRTRDGVSCAELDRRFGAGWRERVLPAARALLDSGALQLDAALRLREDQLPRADAVGRALAAACLAEAPSPSMVPT